MRTLRHSKLVCSIRIRLLGILSIKWIGSKADYAVLI